MMRIKVSGDVGGLISKIREGTARGFASVLSAAQEAARREAPLRSGRLRDSINAYLTGATAGVLVSEAPYSSYLIEGTGVYGPSGRPYVISARKGRALSWPGATHPVRLVRQKGIRPRDFLGGAVDDPLIARAFGEGFEKEAAGHD